MSSMQAPAAAKPRFGLRPYRDWRMGQKLLVTFLLVSLVPLAVTSIAAIRSARDAMLAQGTTQLEAASTSTANSIDQYLASHRQDILAFGTFSSVSNFLKNPTDTALFATADKELTALANKANVESIAVINRDGTVVLSTLDSDLYTKVNTRQYFIESMNGNGGYISDVSVTSNTNVPAVVFSTPVLDSGGNILGVIRSRLNLDGIWDLVEGDKDILGPGTVGILLDENGFRLAHSLSKNNRDIAGTSLLYRAIAQVPSSVAGTLIADKRFGDATSGQIQVIPLQEVDAARRTPGTKTFETSADLSSVRHEAALSNLKLKPWTYVLMTPLPTFTGPADNLVVLFVLVALAATLVVAVGVTFLARSFTQPIVQLTQVADRISLGELDAKIEIDRRDEIGELAESVSRMQASLQAAIERLRARRSAS